MKIQCSLCFLCEERIEHWLDIYEQLNRCPLKVFQKNHPQRLFMGIADRVYDAIWNFSGQ